MSEERQQCGYCGARLDPDLYFCGSCATPYKAEEAVLPRVFRLRPTPGQMIARKAPQAARLFWTYFAVVLGGSVFAHVAIGEGRPGITLVFLDTLLLVTTVLFAVVYWRSLVPQLTRIGFDRWEAWAGLAAVAPLLALNYGYHSLLQEMLGVEAGGMITQLRDAGVSEAALVASIAVFPALAEEIAFRGLLQHWLQLAVSPAIAILLASALFAGMHFSILSLPYLFVVGLLLGWLKWRTNSLWPPMAAHFLHNFAVLAYLER